MGRLNLEMPASKHFGICLHITYKKELKFLQVL